MAVAAQPILAFIDRHPVALAQQQLRNGLEPGVCTVELYRDDTFAAAGRLSCGYFYISAWLVAQ